jgi:ribosomal protein S12 methylthiotransferase
MDKSSVNAPPKAALVTLGCPMNQVDSERIISSLVSSGFTIVPETEADVVVVNTCGFIESAREESIEAILTVADYKKRGTLKALVVAGCLAERYKQDLEEDLPETDAIVKLSDSPAIPELCLKLLKRDKPKKKIVSRALIGSPYTAYLKIAEGCDNRCSYCAIPMIRGPFRSIPENVVVNEAGELAELGVKELILIAQDTTRYGQDLHEKNLPGLLENLHAVDGIQWIRLMYTHPAHITDETIDAMKRLPKVIPYLDIPVQHISGDILMNMGRLVSPDAIRKLIEKLRKEIDGLVLRTSLIVGFPGETKREFRELVEFVEQSRFERLGAFVYSPEEGTSAAELKNRVSEEEAFERYKTIMDIQSGIMAAFQRSLIGREYDMIVDWINNESGEAAGRTYMDAPEVDGNIFVARSVKEGNAFVRVRIVHAETYDLTAEVV